MNKYLVEFLGTLFFLFVIIAVGNPLAIGAALTIAVMLGGKISGGNFNPAVSIMMLLKKDAKNSMHYGAKECILYIVAQVLGGVAAFYYIK
mgnify:CR=1 FL=1